MIFNQTFFSVTDTLFKGLTEPAPTNSKTIYLVDSGLTFNFPFPILLRPERKVDLYLAFDFSSREADNSAPFKVILHSSSITMPIFATFSYF